MIQRSLFKSKSTHAKDRIVHGGITKGRSKDYRPLDRKRPLHIVLKSSHAKGELSLLKRKLKVSSIIEEWAEKTQVTIHRKVNMGNHVHLMVSFKTRGGIQKFLRTITGLIARLVTKAEKGRPFGKRFWDELAFTRIITSFRDRKAMHHYMAKNEVERDAGPALRRAMEDYDHVTKQAKKRGIPREQIYMEMLETLGPPRFV